MKSICAFFTLVFLVACTRYDSTAQALDFDGYNDKIVLSEHVKSDWEQVCIFGPYSNNDYAQSTLGFAWDIESKSSIFANDGISLLVFIEDNRVLAHFEVSRRNVDFANLSGNCLNRNNAIFINKEGKYVLFENV